MLNFDNVRLRPDLFSGVRLNIEALIRAAELKRGHESGPLRVAKCSLSVLRIAFSNWRRWRVSQTFAFSFVGLVSQPRVSIRQLLEHRAKQTVSFALCLSAKLGRLYSVLVANSHRRKNKFGALYIALYILARKTFLNRSNDLTSSSSNLLDQALVVAWCT